MPKRFAEGTEVPSEKSRVEIERLLVRYGADQYFSGWEEGSAIVGFRFQGRFIRFVLPLPSVDDPAVAKTKTGHARNKEKRKIYVEGEIRRLWRSLALGLKAKLEIVSSGISTFEAEFLAHIVLPDGATVGDWAAPQLAAAYESGDMPKALLPAPRGRR